MINHGKVNSGQIPLLMHFRSLYRFIDDHRLWRPRRFLWFVLVLSYPPPGWTSGDSAQIEYTESDRLEAASVSMQRIEILDMSSVVPNSWKGRPPSSSMRLVQFEISDEEPAEVIVFYFGAGQGGGAQANIARWVSQFSPVDGKPVQPTVKNMRTTGGFEVTWVEIQGDYARGVGVGPIGDYKIDQMLIAAITKTPRGNLYFQFHGNRATILEHRDEFRQFVMALEKRSV